MKALKHLVLLFVTAVIALSSFAQTSTPNYPNKPVKVMVGYAAGGAVDLIARSVSQSLQQQLGQNFLVENRAGAGSNIATRATIDAAPDGYTLMLAANAITANMALYKPQPFDAEKDLVAVSLVGRVPVVIAANVNAPYANIQALIAAVKGKPNTIAYGSPGNGATPHLALELFTRAAGIDLQHIPYRGGGPAITDVIGGQLPLVAVNALEAAPHVKSGKLKVLAVLSSQRSPVFPDVPTLAESGFAGFEASVWYGFVAPAATPMPIVTLLHAEVQKALQSKEVKDRMTAVGGEVLPAPREVFVQLIKSERARYEKLIREANIKPD
jgi:tripartite-type tricarboxylate transporter receptor subunit TctC